MLSVSFDSLYKIVLGVFYFIFGFKQQRFLCTFAAGDKSDGSNEVTVLNSLVLNDRFLEFIFFSHHSLSLVWVSGEDTARGRKTKLHYTFLLGTGHFLSFHLHLRGILLSPEWNTAMACGFHLLQLHEALEPDSSREPAKEMQAELYNIEAVQT